MEPLGKQRALISVSDKSGLAEFAKGLTALGFEILSTGGTFRFLQEQGIPVIDVTDYTGFPELMEGRVKTLHPKVHGAILGRVDREDDRASMRAHGIIPFQVVVCNLYPFEKTVAKPNVEFHEAIEQIDVGGPSMVRAAAKNHAHVAIVTDPSQYNSVLTRLCDGSMTEEFRAGLAAAAFERTARYDRAIADYLAGGALTLETPGSVDKFPPGISLKFERRALLRYGENPHQQAAFYVDPKGASGTLATAEVLGGKELSYNNLLDLEAAHAIAREFSEPAVVIIKHNNPCGCAVAATQAEAFLKAYAGDPVSAFGSVMGFNQPADAATAELLCQPDRFVEAIIAPDYDPAALELLTTKPKWAKNVRLLKCPEMCRSASSGIEYKSISGGLLVQDRDAEAEGDTQPRNWKTVTSRQPSEAELADLQFAWLVGKHVKSNAIVFVRDRAVVGVGAGQMSRLDSVRIATFKSEGRSRGAVLASDAFFPFRDGVDAAAEAGITAIVQPGGSRRDDDAIAACNEHGIAMQFTGFRHFRH